MKLWDMSIRKEYVRLAAQAGCRAEQSRDTFPCGRFRADVILRYETETRISHSNIAPNLCLQLSSSFKVVFIQLFESMLNNNDSTQIEHHFFP